jgi:hypothetical protein
MRRAAHFFECEHHVQSYGNASWVVPLVQAKDDLGPGPCCRTVSSPSNSRPAIWATLDHRHSNTKEFVERIVIGRCGSASPSAVHLRRPSTKPLGATRVHPSLIRLTVMASTSEPTAAAAAAHAVAPSSEQHRSGSDTKACIENCRECERACLETIPHCLSKGGQVSRGSQIR